MANGKQQYATDMITEAAAIVVVSGGTVAMHTAAVETLTMALIEVWSADEVALSYDVAVLDLTGDFPERTFNDAAQAARQGWERGGVIAQKINAVVNQ